MRSAKNLAAPSLLVLAFISVFAYSINFTVLNNPITYLFFLDTTDNPPQIYNPKDLGSMFNERGYMNSNSVSYDEKEIINDFNGNLMYKIPIVQGKDKGDLTYEFSLNYNGNVSYQFITADPRAPYWTFTQLHKYNLTAPGWIFSVNGLAVQMLNNFESSFFTKSTDPDGKGVKLLAPGYQITNTLDAGCPFFDKITIMLGDGSTETLYNESGCGFIGSYKTKSLNSFMWAQVEYIPEFRYPNWYWPQGFEEAGWLRRMRLMKGDGLTYIYKEQYLQYKDHKKEEGMASWFWPKAFMLDSIADRFGHSIGIGYNPQGTDRIGRPWLSNVPGAEIKYANIWGTVIGVAVFTIDGKYLFYTDPFGTSTEQEHRPTLQKIVNPSGESMLFDYESYSRSGTNVYKDVGSSFTISIGGYEPLRRLRKVTNYNGGIKEYSYFDEGGANTISYEPAAGETWIHSNSTYYKGEGRDLFFCNSLKEVTVKKGSNSIRKETFNYTYNLPAGRNFEDVWNFPVDTNDEYITTRITSSLDNTYNYSTPTSTTSDKLYRNYAVDVESNTQGTSTDYKGTLQLVTDNIYSQSETQPYISITNFYDVGYANSSKGVFDGTFLNTKKKEGRNNNSVKREWNYSYIGGGDVPISVKEETDPLGITTKTTYHEPFYEEHYEVFANGNYVFEGGQGYSYIYFYLLYQPSEILVLKNSTVLSKKIFSYYDPSSVTGSPVLGYPGQLQYERLVDPGNASNYQETSYEYYNQDTTGEHIHFVGSFISANEGNIKVITDPKGLKKKYYYEIISHQEDYIYATEGCDPNTDEYNCPPKLSYKRMMDNGTTEMVRTDWNATAIDLPSRIDQYINGSRYITNYQRYNNNGNPTGMVNPNNYYSLIEYEKYYRIGTATLPYDFNNSENDTNKSFVTTEQIVQVNTPLQKFGYRNELNGEDIFLSSQAMTAGNFYAWTRTDLSGPDNTNAIYRALMQFDNSNYEDISHIDSAFIEFAPYYVTATHEGVSTEAYKIILRPILDISMNNFETSYNYKNLGNIGVSTSTNCGQNPVDVYTNNFKKVDITELLNSQITFLNNEYKLDMEGLQFELHYTGSGTGTAEMKMEFKPCTIDTNIWNTYSRPKLKIYAKTTRIDTIKTPVYHKGTLLYSYNANFNNTVLNEVKVNAKLDGSGSGNRMKTTEFIFNEFGQLSESRIYTNTSTYNASFTYYNYLDGKGKTVDALNNATKYSYNKFGNLSKTQHPDDSLSLVADEYISSLQTEYYNISSGFINKLTYTDETKRTFIKYFDAVGNLLREEKTVVGNGGGIPQQEDNPYDPDTTYEGQDSPSEIVALITDYKYDSLNRVTQVKTPNAKIIKYWYDGLGRQTQRETPDAGITKYWYDRNNNLTYSQDEVQRSASPQKYTFRTYDGLSRLLTISEEMPSNPELEEDNPTSGNTFTINCYDSLLYAPVGSIFTNIPSDYYISASNNTKGLLVATAYKTNLSDSWSFKFYRYDARGRVIRFWHYIAGLGWKSENYYYNSQNQVIRNWYQPNQSDGKLFVNTYDDAARLSQVNLYLGNQPEEIELDDSPSSYYKLTGYTYNANSQVATHKFNLDQYTNTYVYNNRNWVQSMTGSPGPLFKYELFYNPNGNIRNQKLYGNYRYNFEDQSERSITYKYDHSNRLTYAEYNDLSGSLEYKVINNYDKDGNFTKLKRNDDKDASIDNFTYSYYSGTNRLQTTATETQYEYDYNGNVISDAVNSNFEMKYDHRNLMTENKNNISQFIFWMKYAYDEAGNRVRKTVYQYDPNGGGIEGGEGGGSWNTIKDEFYVRDISGKEIAIYTSSSLTQWNLWGLDQIGHMEADTNKFYYLKDHLGSVRAVLNSTNTPISAQDYDAWGYLIVNRTYETGNTKYKFTGKERDKDTESNYDYFGARYYDSRIGRWGGVDTLFMKHYDFNPYNYVLANPLKLIDPDGKQVDANEQKANYYLNEELKLYEKSAEYFAKGIKVGTEIVISTILGQGVDYGVQQGAKWLGINPNVASGVFTILTQALSPQLNPDVEGESDFTRKNQLRDMKTVREESEKKIMNEKRHVKNDEILRAKSYKNYYKSRERNIPKD